MLHLHPRNLVVARFAAIVCAAATLILSAASASAWRTAHGNPDNSGTVDVRTVAAVKPLATVPLRGLAPGAGAVVAPDGTLYIGDMRGTLMAFRPDGTPAWSRDIGGFQSIISTPAVGGDGSIYVIGSATVRDHTTSPATTRHVAELHKFTIGGGWLWHRPFPGGALGFVPSAPPNILRAQDRDVILLPMRAGFDVRLIAFSGDTGAILANQGVSSVVPETSGGASWHDLWCLVGACFSNTVPPPPPQHRLPNGLTLPFPGVAIHTPSDGGTPLILMSDGLHDLIGLAFTGAAFEERFRVRDEARVLISTPLAWPDGHAMISGAAGDNRYEVMYAGAGFSTIRAAGPLTYAAPTALGDSRHALVHRYGGVTFMSGVTTLRSIALPGESIAAAAASRNHVFVSTASALYTFDKATLQQLAEFPWSGGGLSQPVIGLQGHVYAIARDTLFVFPPPLPTLSDGRLPEVGTVPLIHPVTPGPSVATAPDVPEQAYQPPLTSGGNRLFACLTLDGEGCDKAQHRQVAEAFCRRQGFARAEKIDVDSRKVAAETLDGQRCAKTRCKVFDRILCKK